MSVCSLFRMLSTSLLQVLLQSQSFIHWSEFRIKGYKTIKRARKLFMVLVAAPYGTQRLQISAMGVMEHWHRDVEAVGFSSPWRAPETAKVPAHLNQLAWNTGTRCEQCPLPITPCCLQHPLPALPGPQPTCAFISHRDTISKTRVIYGAHHLLGVSQCLVPG